MRKLLLTLALFVSASAAHAQDAVATLTKTDVAAPPERIFALIEDFRKWGLWSPHEKADSAVKRSYDGAARGVGAVYSWEGDERAGAGRAEITEAVSPSRVVVALDLTRPVQGRLALTFSLEPVDQKTKVSATMKGPGGLVDYAMSSFFIGRSMFGLACAADGAPGQMCKAMVGGRVDAP